MKAKIAAAAQSALHRFGYHLRRLDEAVSLDDAYEEQARLAGSDVREIVEIGAADGRDVVAYAKRYPSARVHAYEPLPENFRKLERATASLSNVVVHECAVSRTEETMPFYVTALADASSLLKSRATGATYDKYVEPAGRIDVQVVTLDDECSRNNIERIDILKMDAQGNELNILNGAHKLLDSRSIKLIYTEVNFARIYENIGLYHEIAAFLDTKGYDLHNLYNLIRNQRGELAWGDAIFVRRAASC
ncbi:MAG: FkbM family methyltransferase [Methylobacteriaceae bacterium]|nr:FkbM family methyltransferase [Methylobacteriaceae bacterium]